MEVGGEGGGRRREEGGGGRRSRRKVSKQLSTNEVDARGDRATPAWVRHDADGPLIPIFQEEEEADCRGST